MNMYPTFTFFNITDGMLSSFVFTVIDNFPTYMQQYVTFLIKLFYKRYFSEYFGLLFILFELIITYFCQNLFIGVMFSCFQSAYSKEKIKSKEAQLWWDILAQLKDVQPERKPFIIPTKGLRLFCYKIISSNIFEIFIFIIIVLNLITMTIFFQNSTDIYKNSLDDANISFTIVFFIEMLLKLIAYKSEYFKETSNKIDFVVVVTGLVEISIFSILELEDTTIFVEGLLKAFQVLRIFIRLLRVIR